MPLLRSVGVLAALAVLAAAQESCTVIDSTDFVVNCPQSGYFTFSTMGGGYSSMDYTPSGQQDTWVFFFQMIAGGLPSTVTDATTGSSCSVTAGTVMAQYTKGGCYNLGQASQATFTYHSNAGDGSYMDIKFLGGDGGRSAEITYYCNRQGTGISSFQYDYESPTKNYQASLQGVEVCQGSPNPPPSSRGSKSSSGKAGWVIVGLFIAACVIYFVGGAVFMKYRRGATDTREILKGPHVEFWGSLPGLVQDGGKFVYAKITGRQVTYQSL